MKRGRSENQLGPSTHVKGRVMGTLIQQKHKDASSRPPRIFREDTLPSKGDTVHPKLGNPGLGRLITKTGRRPCYRNVNLQGNRTADGTHTSINTLESSRPPREEVNIQGFSFGGDGGPLESWHLYIRGVGGAGLDRHIKPGHIRFPDSCNSASHFKAVVQEPTDRQ